MIISGKRGSDFNNVPEFVEVVQIDGVYYIKEFAPKVAPKKKPKSREEK